MKGNDRGVTLIELLVGILILVILITVSLIALNPIKQLNKAYDAQRLADLKSISLALDNYYNDYDFFPQQVPFGQKWEDNSTIYMAKVPDDPQVTQNGHYCYFQDNSANPQWNVLFAKLTNPVTQSACKLAANCLPQGYTTQWACNVSGQVACDTLAQQTLPCGASALANGSSQGAITSQDEPSRIIHAYGTDGSSCEEVMPADPYIPGYCKDSSGFDSNVDAVNTCTDLFSKANTGGYVNRVYCVQTTDSSGETHVGCNNWGGTNYACNTYGNGCVDGLCTVTKKTTVEPEISISNPPQIVQKQNNTANVIFTIHINKTNDTLRIAELFINGKNIGCSPSGNATEYTCSYFISHPSLHGSFTVQGFVLDNSGNMGYTFLHLTYP